MILYRLQISTRRPSWGIEWYACKAEAMAEFRKATKVNVTVTRDVYLDAVEIPGTDRVTLAMAFNRAQDERTNWPGENIAQAAVEPRKTTDDVAKELL